MAQRGWERAEERGTVPPSPWEPQLPPPSRSRAAKSHFPIAPPGGGESWV